MSDPEDRVSTDDHLELLTEHLGFNPRSFIDDIVYAANENLYNLAEQYDVWARDKLREAALAAAQKAAKKTSTKKSDDLAAIESKVVLEAEKGTYALITLFENSLDHVFDVLELFCFRMVFGITERQAGLMTLSHHRGLDLRSPEERAQAAQAAAKAAQAAAKSASAAAKKARKSKAPVPEVLPQVPVVDASAQEECDRLAERERKLRRQIAAAKAVRHSIALAHTAAERRLTRANELHTSFSSVLIAEAAHQDGVTTALLPSTLPQAARKLRADATTLLASLEELRACDPLGTVLAPPASGSAKPWELGRERYLHWDVDEIIKKAKSDDKGKRSTAGHDDDDEEDEREALKTPARGALGRSAGASGKKRKAGTTATPGSSKRTAQ